jgi:transposase
MELHTIGIDLGKTVFHLVGLDLHGEVVVRKKFSRTQLLRFTANVRVGLIGMEACGGSHFLGRALREQRHEVRLIPAQYVKPYRFAGHSGDRLLFNMRECGPNPLSRVRHPRRC